MKIINKLIFILSVLFIGACSESFLDTEDLTKKNLETYYANPADVKEALTGCYDALQQVYNDGVAMPVGSVTMSDLCFGGLGAADNTGYRRFDEYDKTVGNGTQNDYEGSWKQYYKGIFRVNTLLGRLDDVDWGNDADLRNSIEAEARFLRAYFYFDMVRLWEKVPLLIEPSADNIPQSEPDEIYKVIAEDLLFAAEYGSDITYNQIAATEHGHATKWSAGALLARVYLFYTGYYGKSNLVDLVNQSDVLAFLEDIISYSGHDLLENFADLWPAAATYEAAKAGISISKNTYAGETNKEIVFAIKYTYTSDYNGNGDGNYWMVMNGLRFEGWAASGYGNGWGANTVLPEVYTSWDAQDSRREASIMAIAEESINYSKIKDMQEYTGYFTKKYTPTSDSAGVSPTETYGAANFMVGQFQDYYVIRFADVLLMAAELGSPNAVDYVNKVRFRASPDLTPVTSVTKDIIFEERRLELAFEGLRFYDLLRYDNTLQYAANKVSFNGTVQTEGKDITKVIDGNKLLTTRGLVAIPSNQITLSGGVLKQNVGWE